MDFFKLILPLLFLLLGFQNCHAQSRFAIEAELFGKGYLYTLDAQYQLKTYEKSELWLTQGVSLRVDKHKVMHFYMPTVLLWERCPNKFGFHMGAGLLNAWRYDYNTVQDVPSLEYTGRFDYDPLTLHQLGLSFKPTERLTIRGGVTQYHVLFVFGYNTRGHLGVVYRL